MKTMGFFLAIFLGLIVGCTWQNEESRSEPEKSVRLIYRRLYDDHAPRSSLDDPEQFYSERLSSLIKLDQERQLASGELGLLSADPLCECQDPSGLVIKKIKVTAKKEDSAIAAIEFTVGGKEQKLQLDLTKTDDKWRIDDVKTNEVKSLWYFLANSPNPTESMPALPTAPVN